uniref:ATP synthase F0 subunit 8 n=1 Tax=Anthias woodsi TaxID=2163919 RepID=UPI0028D0DFCA|nr:ATP synthase F0 subunit 8 [Anthias woodsi]WMY90335.1 ATP synthase F0 subunit 8 [Anthias woodsi]WNH19896.1 ATP synthase F0 subunit 8 [Anthias woodsi]
MPQLNPNPWLIIFLFSWMIFLALLPLKITAHTYPNELSRQTPQVFKTQPWTWPWH